MKRLLIAPLLVISIGTYAEEAARIEEPAEAKVEEQQNWPTLDAYWIDAKTDNEFKDAIVNGTPTAEIKLGYEYANLDDAAGLEEAHALISRIRLNYQTGTFKGFDSFIQAQYVGPISDKHAPEDPAYDTVSDPEAFRFHQLYIGYTGYNSRAIVGAQEILLDNQRFIGNVGWRFNAQSFNAGLIKNSSINNLTLLYAYADSINESNGEANYDRQYHLFNAEYKLSENNNVSGYAYLQRNDNLPFEEKLDTFGARFWGKNNAFVHNAMLAFQRDAYYGWLSGKLDFDPVDVEVGVEYISGGAEPEERFQTLNGTAHAFNGWADQFTGTGGGATGVGLQGGLVDLWLKGAFMPTEKMELIGIYHYFNTAANTGAGQFSGTYGNEIDLMAKYPVNKHFDLVAALAYYIKGDSDVTNLTNDETVFWLRGTLRF